MFGCPNRAVLLSSTTPSTTSLQVQMHVLYSHLHCDDVYCILKKSPTLILDVEQIYFLDFEGGEVPGLLFVKFPWTFYSTATRSNWKCLSLVSSMVVYFFYQFGLSV